MRCSFQAGGLLQFESTFGGYEAAPEEVGGVLVVDAGEDLVMLSGGPPVEVLLSGVRS